MSDKKLTQNVVIGGTVYEAGTTPPKDIAEQIDNPKAWGEPPAPLSIRTGVQSSQVDKARGQDDKGGDGDSGDGKLTGAKLDEALEAAGLPKTGKVAEKQARLQEHLDAEAAKEQAAKDAAGAGS